MNISHTPQQASRHKAATPAELGYTIIMTALLLIPLMAFTGFAVDTGAWYARGAHLQRAADAAALAGAARMPDFAVAKTFAKDTATKNGFSTLDNITVAVTQLGERKIRVTIVDDDVERYFSSIFLNNMTITRSAVAEFVRPVPLGSPENRFGNDPTLPGSPQPGLWGNIHGPQTENHKGDRYATGCRAANSKDYCNPYTNTEYRGFYIYSVDVPANTGPVNIQVYDAGLFPKANQQTNTGDALYSNFGQPNTGLMTTDWDVRGPDNTVLDYDDAPFASCGGAPGSFHITQGDAAAPAIYEEKWVNLCTVSNGLSVTTRYWIRVGASGDGNGANRYSIRTTGGSGVRLSAFGDMSMFNNQLSVNPNFYLAEVESIHAGKTFLINLYDPGEIGVQAAMMDILAPDGSTASSCKVKVYDNPTDSSPSSSFTRTPCSIQTTSSTPDSNNKYQGLYDGKRLEISIKLAPTYACSVCWWKVRYDLGSAIGKNPSDTTTWSASILGDPVHLVNE